MEPRTEHYRSNSMRRMMAFERRVLRRPAVVGPLQAIDPVCRSVLIVAAFELALPRENAHRHGMAYLRSCSLL